MAGPEELGYLRRITKVLRKVTCQDLPRLTALGRKGRVYFALMPSDLPTCRQRLPRDTIQCHRRAVQVHIRYSLGLSLDVKEMPKIIQ